MNIRYIWTSLILVLALGCASTPSERAMDEKKAGKGDKEPAAEMVLKTVRVPVERKASIRFDDGTLDEYTLSEYNSDGFILKKIRYSASAVLLETIDYRYEDKNLMEKRLLDEKGVLKSRTVYGYTEALLVSEQLEDAEGKTLTAFRYEYDSAGNRILQEVLSSDGKRLAATSYNWDGALLKKTELSDSSGKVIAYSLFFYGSSEELLKQEYYSADGTLLRSEVCEYEGGKRTLLTRLNFKGLAQFTHSFEYGPLGELVKKTVDDTLAGSRYSLNYEYTVREEQRMVRK